MSAVKALVVSPTDDELTALEAKVQDLLARDEAEEPRVLGYGEISCVLALEGHAGRFACKRLPRFESQERFERYARSFHTYLQVLAERGVKVLASELRTVPAVEGGVFGYCIQPILEPEALAPRLLRDCNAKEGRALVERIVQATLATVSPRLGLDAQLSNWAFHEGQLLYLDVTTPLIRDEAGADVLDKELFVASLPWLLRGPVKAFVVRDVISQYHSPRTTLLDLIGNLHKERLAEWIPVFLEQINPHVHPAITEDEALRYYRADARMWTLLQWLRRMDRAWQRQVRRRTYPFILPGNIQR